jgi:O-antigen/teichoic acid export membrane protein
MGDEGTYRAGEELAIGGLGEAAGETTSTFSRLPGDYPIRAWFGSHRPFVLEFSFFLGSVVALQGSRFLFTLGVASGLRPADFTAWAQFVTLVGYAPAILLGIGNGLNRLLPILVGQGASDEADEVEATTWGAVVSVGVVAVALTAVLAAARASTWLTMAMLAGAAMTVYQIQQFTMRSRLLFNRASAQQAGWACIMVASLGLLVVGAHASLASVLWIWTAGSLGSLAIGWALRRPVVRRPSGPRALSLLAMGFPIMLSGLLGNLFYTADRWVAAGRLEPAAAGSYALASLMASAVFLMPSVIAQQLYPRLGMLFGRNPCGATLLAAAHRQSLAAAGASLIAAMGVAAFAAVVLPALLPQYGTAVAPAVILSVGIVALAAGTGYSNLLLVIGAQWLYLGVQAVCFAVALGLMWIGCGIGGGVGLAFGFAMGQLLLTAALAVSARTRLSWRSQPLRWA